MTDLPIERRRVPESWFERTGIAEDRKNMTAEERADVYAAKVAHAFGLEDEISLNELRLHFREALRAQAADTLEACAKLAETHIGPDGGTLPDGDEGLIQDGVNRCANSITADIQAMGSP